MYGTIARMRIKPGAEPELKRLERDMAPQIPGFRFQHVLRTDADPRECYLLVAFESKAAYEANASSPEQHARYLQFRALMETEPEWHDGEIIDSFPE